MTFRLVAAAALAAVAYTVSPLTFLFALTVPVLFWWAGRGVTGDERRWLFGILTLAIVARIAAIAALLLLTSPAQPFNALFPDARFAIARSWWIANIWRGVEIGPVYYLAAYNPYGATSYSYVLGAIQFLFGQSPYGVNFVSVAEFLVAAIALYRLVRERYGPMIALMGFAVLTLWPPMIAWSVSALREALQLALTSIALVFVVRAVRARSWAARVIAVGLIAGAMYVLGTLRSGVIIIVAGGLAAGLAARALTIRPFIGRLSLAALLATGIVVMTQADVQQRALGVAREAILRHVGNVATPGNGYKLLDARYYVEPIDGILPTVTIGEATDFVVRALGAFFLVPFPWQLISRTELAYLPQQVAWYLLLGLGVIGVAAGLRRDGLITWLFVGYIAGVAVVVAPNSGNIGTLVRHRDLTTLALVWLSASGMSAVLSRWPRAFSVDVGREVARMPT